MKRQGVKNMQAKTVALKRAAWMMGEEHRVTLFLCVCFASMQSLCQWDSYCCLRDEKQFTPAEEWSNIFQGNLAFSETESAGQSGAHLRSGRALFTDYLLVCSKGYFMHKSSYHTELIAKTHIKWIMGSMMTQWFQKSSVMDAPPVHYTYCSGVCTSWITMVRSFSHND